MLAAAGESFREIKLAIYQEVKDRTFWFRFAEKAKNVNIGEPK